MKIKMVFDSTIGYSQEQAEAENVAITPFIVMYDDQSYYDGIDINAQEFYALLAQGKTMSTSQPNVAATIKLFSDLLEDYDHIIYCTLPSELSGTYNSGILAASEVDKDKITVLDIKSGLGALRVLAKTVNKMIEDNASIDEIVEKCYALKFNSHAFFVPLDIKGLQKSGRFSNMAGSIFTMIKLKLALEMSTTGYIDKFAISRAENKLYKEIVKKAKEEGYTSENSTIYLLDTNNKERLDDVRIKLLEDFPGMHIEDMYLSPTLGVHIGAGTYAINFVKKQW